MEEAIWRRSYAPRTSVLPRLEIDCACLLYDQKIIATDEAHRCRGFLHENSLLSFFERPRTAATSHTAKEAAVDVVDECVKVLGKFRAPVNMAM